MASTLIGAVVNAERHQGLIASPANGTTHELVRLQGPGLFLSAEISKQGGNSDLTFVILDLDGKNVVNISMAALVNIGLTGHNSYGVEIYKTTDLKTVTIGWPFPLTFNKLLSLKVTTKETGIAQILANVIAAA